MTFAEWIIEVEQPAIRRINRQRKMDAFRSSKLFKFGKAVVKEAGLLAVMASVTVVVVWMETSDFQKALEIACVAGPVKAAAAALYGRLWS